MRSRFVFEDEKMNDIKEFDEKTCLVMQNRKYFGGGCAFSTQVLCLVLKRKKKTWRNKNESTELCKFDVACVVAER